MSDKKILIVEDESVQLTMVAKRLKNAGYSVVGARDGMGAISTARKEQPDLVLLDLEIPAGDGFVVMKRLQTLLPTATIPIVVVSSHDPASSEEACKQARLRKTAQSNCRSPGNAGCKSLKVLLCVSPPTMSKFQTCKTKLCRRLPGHHLYNRLDCRTRLER